MSAALTGLHGALDLLDSVGDVVAGPVALGATPSWAEERGWSAALLALDDDALARVEAVGLAEVADELPGLPASLLRLAREVRALTAPYDGPAAAAAAEPRARDERRVKARKRAQIAAVRALAAPHVARARRVVDVGAGHGHLARSLFALGGVPTVGLEIDARRVDAARALSGDAGPSFVLADATRALPAAPGDLLLGLHACGALGDAIARAAASTPTDAILVSCCFQKVSLPGRDALSTAGRRRHLRVPRETLGLANLAYGAPEAPRILRGHEARLGLRLLLEARGAREGAGDEARGINRRRFRHGLGAVVDDALALRGLPPAEAGEVADSERRAREAHGAIRRLGLPRSMLGRVLELAVVLDRAAHLAEAGHDVAVVAPFPRAVSPRNLAIVARTA